MFTKSVSITDTLTGYFRMCVVFLCIIVRSELVLAGTDYSFQFVN